MRIVYCVLALFMLSACTLGPSTSQQGYRFVELEVEPLGDRSGLVLLNTDQREVPFFAYVENTMEQPAQNIVVEVGNVNDRIIDIRGRLSSQTIGESGVLAGFENEQGIPHWDHLSFDVSVSAPSRAYSTQLRYHVCADVSTVFEETVCIAPPLPRGSFSETCQPTVKRISGGQGAPVAIVGVRQADVIDQVSLYFDVINYGPGLVFSRELDSCSSIPQEYVGVIELESVEIGGEPIGCTDTARMGYELQFQKFEGTTLSCIVPKSLLDLHDDSTTELTLRARFSYRYHTEPVQQPLIIRRV